MTGLERGGLLGFFLLYFLLAFVLRSLLVWRHTGINPYKLPKSDDTYGLVTAGFRRVILLALLYLVAQAMWPQIDPYLGEIGWLSLEEARFVGWVGLWASLLWVLVAQAQMGSAWRIGIDSSDSTELVNRGLFAVSRNPIFLAMRVNLFCLFLIRPNALTLSVWLLGDLLMQFQVRLEEAHLLAQHREQYANYASQVRRWL